LRPRKGAPLLGTMEGLALDKNTDMVFHL
jgi:hypothetical protein